MLGFIYSDIGVCNVGIDRIKRLNLFDFDSAVSRSYYDYSSNFERDYFNLATVLHFILTGIDLIGEADSHNKVRDIRKQLEEGNGRIRSGGEVLADIIQECWTGQLSRTSFLDISRRVDGILRPAGQTDLPKLPDEHYYNLELRCASWIRSAPKNPQCMDIEQYCSICNSNGHEVDMELWR